MHITAQAAVAKPRVAILGVGLMGEGHCTMPGAPALSRGKGGFAPCTVHFCAAVLSCDTAALSSALKLAGGKHDKNWAPGAGNKVARRLAKEDFQVVAWNRDAVKAEALRDAGVSAQETPAAAVQQADVVVLMLADAHSINEVLLGEDVTSAMKGKTVVQMGTIGEPCRKLFACSDLACYQGSLSCFQGPMKVDNFLSSYARLVLCILRLQCLAHSQVGAARCGTALLHLPARPLWKLLGQDESSCMLHAPATVPVACIGPWPAASSATQAADLQRRAMELC